MTFILTGTPSDQLPAVLATGRSDVSTIFVSMTMREPHGRDAEYLEWHSLDHRPEQYRLAGLRHSIRLVSTPACRAARACSEPRYDGVDHVMTYFFAEGAALDQFGALGAALGGDRRSLRLQTVDANYFRFAGKLAAPRAIAGADVLPWRPARGVYLIIEQGHVAPTSLVDVAGVAGVWWHVGGIPVMAGCRDNSEVQITYCFLDDDPVVVAERLREPLQQRWADGKVMPLLAAPFYTLVPFDWDRYLP